MTRVVSEVVNIIENIAKSSNIIRVLNEIINIIDISNRLRKQLK